MADTVTHDNILYAGGIFVNEWNPETETWTEVAELCRGRVFHGASVVPLTDALLQNCTFATLTSVRNLEDSICIQEL